MKAGTIKSLSDVCDITMGQAPVGDSYNNAGEGYALIAGAGDFGDQTPEPSKFTSAPTKISKSGDVILCIRATIGDRNWSDAEYCLGRGVAGLRSKEGLLCQSFLWHWLGYIAPVLKAKGRGATFLQVSKVDIAAMQIPVPPLPEQKRIAAILDKADELRVKRRDAIAELDKLVQATFLDMFGDPVTNPKGWERHRMGDVCEVGSSRRVFANELVESGIPFLRGTEIGKMGDGKAVSPSLFITRDHYDELKRQSGVPQAGDLLLPSICPDGRIWTVTGDQPFYFKDARVLWIKINHKVMQSEYLRQYLKARFIFDYNKIASGTTFAELKIFALKDLQILMPPLDAQIKFAGITNQIFQQAKELNSHNNQLDELFASLQNRAFNGEL